MAEWWQDPDVMAELEEAGENVTWRETGWVDPETGEEARVPIAGIPSDIQQAYNPAVIAREQTLAATGPGSFTEFAARFELTDDGRVIRDGVATNWTPWQLFNQSGGSGGPVWADEITDTTDTTTDTGDPGDGTGDGVDDDVRTKMKDAFFYALRVAGMDKILIDKLWDWVEDELVADPSFSAERALIGMYDSEAFRTRFKGIAKMTDAGFGRRDMPTPGEYIAFEKDVANELKRVGVIEEGASFDNLITSLYVNSVGLSEVTQRLNTAQAVMYQMPQTVRDTLTDWFSDEYGTSITMKTFLDPVDDWSNVQDDITTAQSGGWGRMVAGLNAGWDADLAKQVSDLGLSQAEQWDRFAQLKEQEMLFTETLDESIDLRYGEEGVRAQFNLAAEEEGGLSGYELSDLITRRKQQRGARFRGGGGAILTDATTGFGAANA